MVTLGPGDVLYAPPHWWHFVQCLDMSLSANTWIPLPSDDDDRVTEAVTKTLVAFLTENNPDCIEKTASEDDNSFDVDAWLEVLTNMTENRDGNVDQPKTKKAKEAHYDRLDEVEKFLENFAEKVEIVETVDYNIFSDAMKSGPLKLAAKKVVNDMPKIGREEFLRALLDPENVRRIASKLNLYKTD